MRQGESVQFTDPRTHQWATGVLERVRRFRTGFVAAFVKTSDDRTVTVAVTALRKAGEA